MAVYTDAIQKLYVAYFNRPADYEGLAFWEKVLVGNGGNLAFVSSTFAKSNEYQQQIAGKSYFQIVNQIYQNLFNRDADVTGLEFWAARLREGTFTVDQIVKVIADNASDTDAKDKTIYANKVAAATAFTAELNTAAEIIGYSGDKANAAAKVWLSGVSTTESLNAAIQPAALNASINSIAQAGLVTGPAQVLTTGIDPLVGTSGNDVFTGLINNVGGATGDLTTLTALDSIAGGAGVDTLNINALTAVNGIPSISVSGVEVVNIRAASSVDANISAWTGVEQFNVTEAAGNVKLAAGATTNISATLKAGAAPTTTIIDGGKDIVVRVTDSAAAGQTINVGGTTAAKGVVSVESIGKAAVAGTDLTLGAITVKGGTTINVNQSATSSTAGLTVGTATHNQGAINITGDASTTTVNVKQTAASTAVAGVATVAAVTETASVKFTALAAGQSFTVAGLTFTASKALTAAEVATAFSNLIDGVLPVAGDTQGSGVAANGIYTGVFGGWTSAAANGDTVVFTSLGEGDVTNLSFSGAFATPATANPTLPTVTTTNGVTGAGKAAVAGVTAGLVTINDAASSIKTVSVDSYATGSAITGASTVLETLNLSNSNGSFTAADSAATLALNLNKVGTSTAPAAVSLTSAPATLNVKSTGANTISLTANLTEAMNVSGTGTLGVNVVDLSNLKTVTVTETAGLNTGATLLANVTSVTTTGTTGTTTVVIDGDKATYAGGAGVDNLTIDNTATTAIDKAINLGAGNDKITLTGLDATKLSNTGAITIEGGEGTDTIALSAAAAAVTGLSGTAAFEAKFNGFERLEVGQLSTSVTVNLDNLDDINYVISKGIPSAAALVPVTTQGAPAVPSATESASFTFADITVGQTIEIAGVTVTATGGTATAADIAAAFRTGATVGNAAVTGTVAGYTLTGTGAGATFTSTTANSNVPDLTPTVTGAAQPAVTRVQGNAGSAAVTESSVITFGALTAGQSYTVAGRTVTAGASGASATDVAAAFSSGTGAAGVTTVTGTLTNFTAGAAAGTDVTFTSTTPGTNVTNITTSTSVAGAAGAAVLTLDKMLANATVQFDAAGSVVVKLADVSGTSDVVNLITNANSGVNIGTATVAGVETINVTANDTVSGSGISSNTLTVAADAAKTINVTGAGDLNLVLDAVTKVVTAVNGSTATGNLTIASSTAADAVAVTITGGAGADVLTASSNKADVLIGGAGGDTLVAGTGLASLTGGAGNDLFKIGVPSANVNSYATITDFAAGDLIQFVGANAFTSAKVTLGETAVFQDYANAAVNALNNGQIGWFTFGGNTYVIADVGGDSTSGFVNGQDFIVKLTGTVDLTNASFNATYGTIGLV